MLFPKSWCSSNWTQAWSKNRTYFRMWYNVKLSSKYLCSLLGLSRAFLRESCAFFTASSFMSLFISGMNLSVIVFPPASPCPSSLRTDLSSFSRTQWETLLPKSFQHQPFSPLQGKEVTPGASPVASWVPRSPSGLGNSNHVCGGHVRWLCSPEVALLRWKENWKVGDVQAGCPEHTHGPDPAVVLEKVSQDRQTLEKVSDGIPRRDRHCVPLQSKLLQVYGATRSWVCCVLKQL